MHISEQVELLLELSTEAIKESDDKELLNSLSVVLVYLERELAKDIEKQKKEREDQEVQIRSTQDESGMAGEPE